MPKHPFDYHRPSAEQVERITAIREACKAMHDAIMAHCPSSRERSLAITNLEQVSMWANKAIVMEEGTPVDPSQSPAPKTAIEAHFERQGIVLNKLKPGQEIDVSKYAIPDSVSRPI